MAWTPAFALGDSRISLQPHFEQSAVMDNIEPLHAAAEGDRPRRLIVAVRAHARFLHVALVGKNAVQRVQRKLPAML
jgi:hypothetical protein